MWPIVIAGAKIAGTAAASTAASYGTQSVLSKLFGGGSEGVKKAANYQSDIKTNTGHAVNYFNENYGYWKDYVTTDEWNYLAEQIIPKVQSDPYYGGLGNTYNSRYVQFPNPMNTVPGVGITKDIDSFIDTKIGLLQANGQGVNQGGGMTLTEILNKAQDTGFSVIDYYTAQEIAKQQKAAQEVQGINPYPGNPTLALSQVKDNSMLWVTIGIAAVVVFFILRRR
jgi:hypothetical protein